MFWWLQLALAIYLLAMSALWVFLDGAAQLNERWDQSNDALWQRLGRCHSPWEEEHAA
jgi:hypothetical protein